MENNGMEFGSQSITPALNLVAMVLSMFLCLLPLKHISEVFAPNSMLRLSSRSPFTRPFEQATI